MGVNVYYFIIRRNIITARVIGPITFNFRDNLYTHLKTCGGYDYLTRHLHKPVDNTDMGYLQEVENVIQQL